MAINCLERTILFVTVLLLCQESLDAFSSLTMVASGRPMGRRTPIRTAGGVTSGFISQLAVGALKRRLANQTGVRCDVSATSGDLFLGKVGPVTVMGRGWESQLGLSCRAIEATVDACELDMGKILSIQKLRLLTPANGRALIALNGRDFANFITHPLMKPPGIPDGESSLSSSSSQQGIEFLKENVHMDLKEGSVTFYGMYVGKKWKLTLQRGQDTKALVTAVPEEPSPELESMSGQLTQAISTFFNEMVFELDGTFLTFNDMMLTPKGPEPTLMLALDIVVRKFPSPGLMF